MHYKHDHSLFIIIQMIDMKQIQNATYILTFSFSCLAYMSDQSNVHTVYFFVNKVAIMFLINLLAGDGVMIQNFYGFIVLAQNPRFHTKTLIEPTVELYWLDTSHIHLVTKRFIIYTEWFPSC